MNKKGLLTAIAIGLISQISPYGPLSTEPSAAEDAANMRQFMSTRDCPGCDLSDANFEDLDLSGANLQGANLSGASFVRSQLTRANLESANLSNTFLMASDFTGANLQSANLTSATAFYICQEYQRSFIGGRECSRQFLLGRLGVGDFCEGKYDLFGNSASEALCGDDSFSELARAFLNFRTSPSDSDENPLNGFFDIASNDVDMRGANLTGANLQNADLTGVDLRYAALTTAEAAGANFSRALLIGATLTDIQNAEFEHSWVTQADAANWLREYDLADLKNNRQSVGRRYVRVVGRAQQKYYVRDEKFTTAPILLDLDDLYINNDSEGYISEDEFYRFGFILLGDGRVSLQYALAKVEGYTSYISIVSATDSKANLEANATYELSRQDLEFSLSGKVNCTLLDTDILKLTDLPTDEILATPQSCPAPDWENGR